MSAPRLWLLLVALGYLSNATTASAARTYYERFGQHFLVLVRQGQPDVLAEYVHKPLDCSAFGILLDDSIPFRKNCPTYGGPSVRPIALHEGPFKIVARRGTGDRGTEDASVIYLWFVPRRYYAAFLTSPAWKRSNWQSKFFGCMIERLGGKLVGHGDFCFTGTDGPFGTYD